MRVFVKNNLKHVIFVLATIAFFFVSPLVQQKLVLRSSTIVVVSDPLPPLALECRMYVDQIRLSNARDEVYQMDGWGFLILDSKLASNDYERTILLVSDSGVLAISTSDVPRKDVQNAFVDLGLSLDNSGFAGKFPMNAIPKGNYTISLLFTLPDGTQTRCDSRFELSKTFNSLLLVPQDDKK